MLQKLVNALRDFRCTYYGTRFFQLSNAVIVGCTCTQAKVSKRESEICLLSFNSWMRFQCIMCC